MHSEEQRQADADRRMRQDLARQEKIRELLTGAERHTITHALRTAASVFRDAERGLTDNDAASERMREAMKAQAEAADWVLDWMEE